jgi:hypothetical protein
MKLSYSRTPSPDRPVIRGVHHFLNRGLASQFTEKMPFLASNNESKQITRSTRRQSPAERDARSVGPRNVRSQAVNPKLGVTSCDRGRGSIRVECYGAGCGRVETGIGSLQKHREENATREVWAGLHVCRVRRVNFLRNAVGTHTRQPPCSKRKARVRRKRKARAVHRADSARVGLCIARRFFRETQFEGRRRLGGTRWRNAHELRHQTTRKPRTTDPTLPSPPNNKPNSRGVRHLGRGSGAERGGTAKSGIPGTSSFGDFGD